MSPRTTENGPDPRDGSDDRCSGDRATGAAERASSGRDERGRIDRGRRGLLRAIPLAGVALFGSGTASARARERATGTGTPGDGSSGTFPDVIPLPDGFQPEGIVTGRGTEFFVGSLEDGSVYRGNLRTGVGEVLVDRDDRVAVGLSYDGRSDRIFAGGNVTGKAFVYDAETGEDAGVYQFAEQDTFVNDVVVTRTAAYFTDSFRPFLYRVPLGPGGRLPEEGEVEEIQLGGEFDFKQDAFNANGIDASPNGEFLIVVNSDTGLLYRVDPETGEASEIDLGEETDLLVNGDGILLDGKTLYVVRNFNDLIAVVELDPGATEGELVDPIEDEDFDVPTTVAEFGSALYAVNARFGVENPGEAEYDVVRVRKR